MSVTAIARRYAEALADIAISSSTAEQVDHDLKTFADLVETNKEFRTLLASPIISQKDKLKILERVIDLLGPQEVIANLLKLLLSRYRLHHVATVYREFRREMNDREGVVLAEVTTAEPIPSDLIEMLQKRFNDLTGKLVEMHFKVDPSLIGGAVTQIGSMVYDGSIRAHLDLLKHQMIEAREPQKFT